MKYILLTDIHFGCKGNSDEFNQQCLDFLQFVQDYVDEHFENEDILPIFLGDWYHNRNTINVKTLNYGIEGLRTFDNIGTMENSLLLVGNHDIYYKDRRDTYSPINPDGDAQINIVDEPLFVKSELTGNHGCLFVPWLLSNEKLTDLINEYNPEYVFGHFELPSFKLNNQVTMDGEFNPADYSNVKRIFSGHFHCLTPDHEVLTENGWKSISEVKIDDKVITYNTSTKLLEYNKVENTHKKYINEKIYHLYNKHYDTLVTGEHRVYCEKEKIKNGIKTYEPIFYNPEKNIESYVRYVISGNKNNAGLDISDNMIRLIIWIVADGYMEIKNGSFDSIRFHLSKERKIKELLNLLNDMGIEYTSHIQKDKKRYKIRISKKVFYNIGLNNYLDPFDKKLPKQFRKLNNYQTQIVYDTYAITDGHKYNNTVQISTSKKDEMDILQEIFTLNNIHCQYSIRYFKNKNHKNAYIMSCCPGLCYTKPRGKQIKNETIDYDGYVYCLTVPNSTFLVRRNGKTFITGNCRQSKSNVYYIGNCFSHDFSDSNDWHNKGFGIFDPDENELKFIEWENAPKYCICRASELDKMELGSHMKLKLINNMNLPQKTLNEIQEQLLSLPQIEECLWYPQNLLISEADKEIDLTNIPDVNIMIGKMLSEMDMQNINNNKLVTIYNNLEEK